MTEESLRETVQAAIADAVSDLPGGKWLLRSHRLVIADRILALPELEALKLKTVKGLGHSISTNQRDPV